MQLLFVNYVGLNEDIIKNILEIKGSYKIGKYMPGTNIPIVNEKLSKNKSQITFCYYLGIYDTLIKVFKKMDIKESL